MDKTARQIFAIGIVSLGMLQIDGRGLAERPFSSDDRSAPTNHFAQLFDHLISRLRPNETPVGIGGPRAVAVLPGADRVVWASQIASARDLTLFVSACTIPDLLTASTMI